MAFSFLGVEEQSSLVGGPLSAVVSFWGQCAFLPRSERRSFLVVEAQGSLVGGPLSAVVSFWGQCAFLAGGEVHPSSVGFRFGTFVSCWSS